MYKNKQNQIGRTLLEEIAVIVLSTIVVMGIYKAFRLAVDKANTKKLEQDMGVRVNELRHQALTPSGITLGSIQVMKASNYTVETVMVNPGEKTFTLRVGQDNANLSDKKPLSYEQCQSLIKSSTFSPNNANDACKENQAYTDFVFPMFADLRKFTSGEYNPTRSGEATPAECGVHALHDGTTCVCETGYENWRRGVGCTLIALTCDVNGFQEGISCQCNAGYFGNGLACTQCGERQYSAARARACDTCDPGQTHNADHTGCDNCTGIILGACGCDPDEIPDGDGGCEPACPYDHSSTTERPGYQLSGTICYCEPGYVPDNAQQECVPEDEDSDCRLGTCQTCVDNGAGANPRYRYGLIASGTPCEIGGLQGTCNGNGICYPTGGQACSSIDGCPAGQFCNYGGTYNSGSNQSGHFGQTANVCMRVNAQRFVYQGSVYFYNTKKDLQAWCRAADNTANCTWGYLAKPGAESWCYSLGARLLTEAEMNAVVDTDNQGNNVTLWDVLKKKLPKTGSSYNYWLDKGYGRPDGYANSGGVVCYGGQANSDCGQHASYGFEGNCLCDVGYENWVNGSGCTLCASSNMLGTCGCDADKAPDGNGGCHVVVTPDGWSGDDGSNCLGTRMGGNNSCQVCVNGEYVDSDAKCGANQVCLNGQCGAEITNEPEYSDTMCKCIKESGENSGVCGGDKTTNKWCSTDSNCISFGMWNSKTNKCERNYCSKNSNCSDAEFCYYNKNIDNQTGPYIKGVCTQKSIYKGSLSSATEAEGYLSGNISRESMDWYSAQNFCRSYGKNLVSLSNLGLEVPSSQYGCVANPSPGLAASKCNIDSSKWSALRNKFSNLQYANLWTKNRINNSAYNIILYNSTPWISVSNTSASLYYLCK